MGKLLCILQICGSYCRSTLYLCWNLVRLVQISCYVRTTCVYFEYQKHRWQKNQWYHRLGEQWVLKVSFAMKPQWLFYFNHCCYWAYLEGHWCNQQLIWDFAPCFSTLSICLFLLVSLSTVKYGDQPLLAPENTTILTWMATENLGEKQFKSKFAIKISKSQKTMSFMYFQSLTKCPSPNMLYTKLKNEKCTMIYQRQYTKCVLLIIFPSFRNRWLILTSAFHPWTEEFFTKPSESQLGCSVSAVMHTFTHAGQKQCIHLNRL